MSDSILRFNNQVEKSVTRINQIDQSQGSIAAYKALRKEFDDFVKNPNHSLAENNAFVQQVTNALGSQMTGLSAAWALDQLQAKQVQVNEGQGNYREYTEYKSFGKNLTKKTIENDANRLDYNESGQLLNPLDRIMSNYLVENFKQYDPSKPVLGLFGHSYLSHDALISKINKIDRANFKEQELEHNRALDFNIAQSFVYNNHELFDTVDGIDGNPDGKIHKKDLHKFIQAVQDNPNGALAQSFNDGGQIKQEQFSMINYLYENWDSPQVKLLQHHGSISLDSMATALRFSSVQSMDNYMKTQE